MTASKSALKYAARRYCVKNDKNCVNAYVKNFRRQNCCPIKAEKSPSPSSVDQTPPHNKQQEQCIQR